MAEAIVDRADGNPFFLEELTRCLNAGGPAASLPVPATIQEVLMARIIRLPEGTTSLPADRICSGTVILDRSAQRDM